MPSFAYTGSETRYYPTIGREVSPGDAVDWADEPEDGRWSPVGAAPSVPAVKPAPVEPDPAPTAPVDPAPVETAAAAPNPGMSA